MATGPYPGADESSSILASYLYEINFNIIQLSIRTGCGCEVPGTIQRNWEGLSSKYSPSAAVQLAQRCCHCWVSELNSVFGLEKVDRWNRIRTSAMQSSSRPTRFLLGFSNDEKGAPRQEISKWSTVCSTFSRSGWSVVSSASLAKGSTSKKETVTAPPQSSDSD
jgi:hypothetical protein